MAILVWICSFWKKRWKSLSFYYKETMFPYLTMALKTVICLVNVFISFLTFHQEFHLIKIHHGWPKFTVLGKSGLWLRGSRLCNFRFSQVKKGLYFKVCLINVFFMNFFMKDTGLLWFVKHVFRKISKVATSYDLLGHFQPFAQCAINHKSIYYGKLQYKL